MTILSLNVWGGQRCAALLPFIAANAATVDVFCLQEMTSAEIPVVHSQRDKMTLDLAEQIQSLLPNHQLTQAPSREQWGEQLALAVRRSLRIYQSDYRRIVAAGPPGIDSSGGAFLQTVTVEHAGRPLRIGHLHGYWERDEGEDKPPRDEQIANLMAWIDEETSPVVLCGDFNMNRASRGIDRLSARLTNLIRTHDVPTTRPRWNAYHGTVADYCFVSPELAVRSFTVLSDDVSDHLPLMLQLES